MNVTQKQNGFLSKSLAKIATCTFMTATLGIGQLWAAPGSVENSRSEIVQQKTTTVTGRIVDEKGDALIGVNVLEKGTSNGTITDSNGNYRINVSSSKSVLVFSYIGYLKQEIAVGNKSQQSIILKEDSKNINEVVVIGYGTQKKGDITSAVASVKAEDFTQGFIRDAADLVKGKVAGLNISNGSGDPSSQSNIMLRGVSSLYGGTTPLILIDGVAGGLNTVAPEDIASIDVLKDASAAAIYGTRGANGVILITTKTGRRNMKPEVSYNAYVGASTFGKKADFLNAGDIRSLLSQGVKLPFTDEGASTDWLKEITQTGISQNHSISLKGGQENSNYSANVTYNNKNGVFKRTNNNELKAIFDINQYMLNDKVKLNLNIVKGIDNTNAVGSASSFNTNIYRQALIRNPTAPIRNASGNWAESSRFQYYNPVAMINETDGIIKDEYTRLTSNVTLRLFEGFETNAMFSTRSSNGMTGYYETKKNYSNTMNGMNGVASKSDNHSRTDDMELTAKYNKNIGLHKFSFLAGYSYDYNVGESEYAYNYNFPSDNYSYNNLYAGYALKDGKASMSSSKSDSKLIGFFGRVSYGYADRYNILASIRREGSSKFGLNHKWGTYSSVSLGWTISNEKFMKDITWINYLKLRTGYGVTGVIPSLPYQSQTLYAYDNNGYFDNNGTWVKGLIPTSNPNPDLRWEKSGELNIGLDFGILKNRINGSVDVYHKKTTDMLWWYNVPVPPNLYNTTLANVGAMRNQGIEVVLNVVPVDTKIFHWNSSLTLSHNENKLLSLSNDLYQIEGNFIEAGNCGDPISFATHRLEVGKPIGNFWGLKSVDITSDGKWIIETPKGERKTLTPEMYTNTYKQYLGNGIPKVNLGWTNTFHYKNLDLSMTFNGAFGFKILNFQRMFYENPNINYNMLKSAFDKVYGKAVLNYPQTYVSYYIENGDYLKLDNITIGYNFNVKKINLIKALRIYASAQNVFCITGYKGLDPEIDNSDMKAAGDDSRDKYPTIRTLTFGLNVTF
ncbi:TonB-dependent receptor [Paludibacter sp.]|uniref:SusC/RagA family TonB-linked outer membrane protein n=1 Tax=Paludibacter sp. TaxID=1898105 RepID=UPI001353DFD9|nr:TonB-dependent receptor [Paludibacter sp.]MTK53988.1 TonB-dependent receptor [Paludibacter sp.]